MRALALATVVIASAALADAPHDRFSAGGYFRIMTRPDFQGGNGQLGFSTLYGRLLNEGPYAVLELNLDVLRARPGSNDVWAQVHAKLEGGSVSNAEGNNGNLSQFRLSQLYVKAGNVLLDRVTWQIGTLENYYDALGLYDMRPATIFNDTVGVSARYNVEHLEVLAGVGDSGYAIHGASYNTVVTGGGAVKLHVNDHLELGGGGQYGYEPEISGNRFAPYFTPDLRYEDFVRHEVVQHFLEENPNKQDLFPLPQATSAQSWRAFGYFGFGGFGPLVWDSFFITTRRLHPQTSYLESYGGRDYTIYIKELTDQRQQFFIGNEMQLHLIPQLLDAVWAVIFGDDSNPDNTVAPGEDNRTYYSTVLRLQLYLTPTVHFLVEGSAAQERSKLGNLYREHFDSVFANTGGVPDARGLAFGDSDTRNTFQFKGGLVLNPLGPGIYTRPSLRLLYGAQYSSQQNAFGNGFVENLDQFNVFQSPERHWHQVIAVEAEAWF